MPDNLKYDDGKLRFDLVPPIAIERMAAVRTKSLEHHDKDNWHGVENYRWLAALERHLTKYKLDPLALDPESGLPHIDHVLCNVAFLASNWHSGRKEIYEKETEITI